MQALRIIPLGGLGEVGKNMTVFEVGDERIVVDAGLAFPRDEHFGVDLVLADVSYLVDRPVLAVVLTHAHEDHVGGLPYLLREVDVGEVIGTRLTLGLVKSKLDEHKLSASTRLTEVEPGGASMRLGPFTLEFIRMAHSIPDAMAIVIETEAGRVLHTGDWKLDHTPVDGLKTDVGALAALGNRGVDLLLGDSTNAERPGMTGSERLVGEAFRQLIPLRTGRIIVASFASNMHRVQQAAEVAIANGRKVAVVGRSMRKNMNIARTLGYVELPGGVDRLAEGGDGAAARQGPHPLHGEPGRADVGADADRVRRPSERHRRERRHRDHLREAGARERAAGARLDQPARAPRRRGAPPGGRAGARLGPRVRRGAAGRSSRSCAHAP